MFWLAFELPRESLLDNADLFGLTFELLSEFLAELKDAALDATSAAMLGLLLSSVFRLTFELPRDLLLAFVLMLDV